ncbi:hypothetical protein ACFQMB_06585 [Pseudobowmanella zhangzhouensis]|uniref:hypothetical protein n=1 Tax=Pseudobowmanella zhangzhouensis TaxID=1537679 RepID=UPI0036224818
MIFMFFCCQSGAEELVVVVNKANPVTTLQKSQIIDIYMGKFVAFPNGASAFPVDFESDMSLRTAFSRRCLSNPFPVLTLIGRDYDLLAKCAPGEGANRTRRVGVYS